MNAQGLQHVYTDMGPVADVLKISIICYTNNRRPRDSALS